MKLMKGIVYTREIGRVALALQGAGLVVNESGSDRQPVRVTGPTGARTPFPEAESGPGTAWLNLLLNRVRITTLVSDEMIGAVMESVRVIGECKFSVLEAPRLHGA
ncbi:hypothetical protein L4X63_21920 [Geomonas sp. Red32]|uniref:hypothetical protein n=1 Tax=Geomonas sp. Red32 TaxID=2912856 RepID=UPI00202CDE9A|nr:hypothetical protein [Geomonas sp. Red32]MCM0084245.1 hypothetical protein [Geomonas sp. Red32]